MPHALGVSYPVWAGGSAQSDLTYMATVQRAAQAEPTYRHNWILRPQRVFTCRALDVPLPVGFGDASARAVGRPVLGAMRPRCLPLRPTGNTGFGCPGHRVTRPGSPPGAEHFRAASVGAPYPATGDIGANPGLGGHPTPGDLDRPEVGSAGPVKAHRTGRFVRLATSKCDHDRLEVLRREGSRHEAVRPAADDRPPYSGTFATNPESGNRGRSLGVG